MISCKPLWKTMKERGVTTYALICKNGFSTYTITNLKRNRSITMNTMEKLCAVLNGTPNDIVAFTENEGPVAKRKFCNSPLFIPWHEIKAVKTAFIMELLKI